MSVLRARGIYKAEPGGNESFAARVATASTEEQQAHLAKPGDLVIVQEHYTTLKPITLTANAFFNNRYGRFAHSDIIDRQLGRRVNAQKNNSSGRQASAGFVHALTPTPELWAQAMDHRTQIVYPHDAALISLLLELRPGAVLVECGTGSGSACTAFARVVAPGTVYSFDFHKERADAAACDFKKLGIHDVVRVRGGVDVVKDGFIGVPDFAADAVFLDLPMPYEMGEEVRRVLRNDGTVCMFSPCVEQVQKTCQMLRSEGFHSLRTVTAPVKTYETREMKLETPGFDELQVCDSNPDEPPTKRLRKSENGHGKPDNDKTHKSRSRTAGAERLAISAMGGEGRHVGRVIRPNIRLHSKPFTFMKGHTSYLTFARKCTGFIQNEKNDANGNVVDTVKINGGTNEKQQPVMECTII